MTARRLPFLLLLVSCSGAPQDLAAPPPGGVGGGISAVVAPIYDENGDPNIEYFSSDVTITVSGPMEAVPWPDLYASRTFGETFEWQPGVDWVVAVDFLTTLEAFGPGEESALDVRSGQLNFATLGGSLTLRTGGSYPSTIEELSFVNPLGEPATNLSLAKPDANPVSFAMVGGTATAPTPLERRKGVVRGKFLSPAGSRALLADLRSRFTEAQVGQRSTFRGPAGSLETSLVYDHTLGTISEVTASRNGIPLFRTTKEYADVVGLKVLRSETTMFFGPDGKERYRTTRSERNLQFTSDRGGL